MSTHKVTSQVGLNPISFETGKMAKLADGAVVVTSGETTVLVTACSLTKIKPGQSWFPLSVEYKERAFAAGVFPGGYFKREGRPTEKEILTCRMTDRPLRPLFPKGYLYETQIVALMLSADGINDADILSMNGAPVGKELGRYSFRRFVEGQDLPPGVEADDGNGIPDADGGSIMMVVATDAPLDARNLKRLARRALLGLARTGSSGSNGSGDYVIAFSSDETVRRSPSREPREILDLPNDGMAGLFQATIEATEEAIYNSLLKATSVTGRDGRSAEALPVVETLEVLRKYGAVRR